MVSGFVSRHNSVHMQLDLLVFVILSDFFICINAVISGRLYCVQFRVSFVLFLLFPVDLKP